MILTVTLNAAIDKRYVVKKIGIGEVNRVIECTCTPGGKGLNVSRTAAIMEGKVTATGFLGGYTGKYIENLLMPFHIKTDFCHLKEESRSCINVWDEESQEQTEFLEPGPTVRREELQKFIEKYKELVKKTDTIVISGSVPRGLDDCIYQKLIGIAKREGKQVILDASGKLLEKGIEVLPTMIKPNIDEIRMLTGKNCENIDEILMAAKAIYTQGIEIVVISLGKDGAFVVSKEGVFRAEVPQIDVVNTVGCGDAMVAGFALGMERKMHMKEMFHLACAISVAAALCEETGIFRLEDMEYLLPYIIIEQIE